jgi:protein disulfide-isomerase
MRLFLFFALILLPMALRGQEGIWLHEYKKALEISKEKNRSILMVFLGPDKCPWSQKLEGDVLNEEAFVEPLGQDFILLKVSDAQLAKKYHLKEWPAMVVVDPQGELVAKFQYLPLSALELAAYIKEVFFDFQLIKMSINHHYLKQIPFEQLKTLFQKALRLGNNHFKEVILEEGLKKDRGAFFLMQQYLSVIEKQKLKTVQKLRKKILDRDPKNEYGTHLKIAVAEFQVLTKKVKPHRAIKPLLEYTQKFGKQDKENIWKVEMMMAQFLFSQKLIREALFHASLSYDAAPDGEREGVSQSIEYFKSHSITP